MQILRIENPAFAAFASIRRFALCLFHCYTFREISWLVHIVAALDREVIGEELEGDKGENGREHLERFRDVEYRVGYLFKFFISFGRDGDDGAFAGFDLLNARFVLFVDAVFGGDDD